MPKVVKSRRGKGWEDMLKEAMERDRQSQEDKKSANSIRDSAAADAKKRGGSTKRKRKMISGGGDTEDELDNNWITHERYMGLPRDVALAAIRRERAKRAERIKNPPPKRVYTTEEVDKQVAAARRGHERFHPGKEFDEAAVRRQFNTTPTTPSAPNKSFRNMYDNVALGKGVRRKRCKGCNRKMPKAK